MTHEGSAHDAHAELGVIVAQLGELVRQLETGMGSFDPREAPDLFGAYHIISRVVGGAAATAAQQFERDGVAPVVQVPEDTANKPPTVVRGLAELLRRQSALQPWNQPARPRFYPGEAMESAQRQEPTA